MRDNFNIDVKRTLAARVGNQCSNPKCRALTSGPQKSNAKSLNVGVAAHITAASPGGPRYNAQLSQEHRESIENGVWLCQNCAKLVDNDPDRFTETILRRWKEQAEDQALAEIGQTRGGEQQVKRPSERQVKRNLALKKRIERDFLHPLDRRAKWPYEKFAHSEVIIHSIDDETYPTHPRGERISGWFKVEVWDFYFNGLEIIIRPEAGVIDEEGRWSVVESEQKYDVSKYKRVTLLRVGRIPWRNIVEYDLRGDEYYNRPHIYCKFVDNGTPFESIVYYMVNDEQYWPLDSDEQLDPFH